MAMCREGSRLLSYQNRKDQASGSLRCQVQESSISGKIVIGVDSMKRSRNEIIEAILTICKDWTNKTKIVYGCDLNFNNAKPYLAFLIEKGLLEHAPSINGRDSWKITDNGLAYLEILKTTKELFGV